MPKPDANSVGACWDTPAMPAPELLKALKAGPFSERREARGEKREAGGEWTELIAGLRREEVAKSVIFIGTGTCGLGAGAAKTVEAIKDYLKSHKIDAELVEVGCVGICSDEPIVDVQLPGRSRVSFRTVTAEKVEKLLDAVFAGGIPADLVLGQYRGERREARGERREATGEWAKVPFMDEHPFFVLQKRWVLANSGLIDPNNIDEYIARGGYSAMHKVLHKMTPDEVCDATVKSGLRGRGGGGFPAGKKWQMARQSPGEQKYLICNADEGDPGAFMDRAVCESDPFRLLEGMVIAAYGIGATKAYIYIRAEYPLAVRNLKTAIARAREYGLLGENIIGSGFNLDIVIKMGAGAFVCGEETALMHSIEGKRGMPRPRPPYPSTSGLFGKPTVINNVETLANVAALMQMGWEKFAAVGTAGSKGTKVFALSGLVNRTGLVEVPMGTTIRQVVFDVGGGIPNNKKCKAVQIGGPSGGCIPEPQMDVACDYEALKNFGAIMGSGGLVVMDENTCMVDVAKFFMEFIQNESCGKCIPCREGTRRMLEILQAITRPRRKEEDTDALLRFQGIMYLKELGETIRKTSLCGLGQTAPNPVLSTLRWFRDEYEAHIFERSCPAGACKELVGAPCQSGCPVGTEVWRYVAHVGRGEYADAYRVIRTANPFPSACARVCNHPCEDVCRCGTTGGEPIAIRTLKRFVVDNVDPASYKPLVKKAKPGAPKVAVVGAGPSGLAAAHQLSLAGYPVTIFEKEKQAGGMLVCAIPAYRLPRETLRKEIASLLNENVELRLNQALGRDFTIESLQKDGYKAIYVATGSHKSKKLGLEGEDAQGVIPGIKFLKSYNLDGEELAQGRVGIIGGGNSALDAARVVIRQQAVTDVTIFYRRTRAEMPAYPEEIEAALEEGIKIVELVAPIAVDGGKGSRDRGTKGASAGHSIPVSLDPSIPVLKAVQFIRNELGERDASGRARPVPVKGSEYTVELDTLIAAISEDPESEPLSGLSVAKNGALVVNTENFTAGRPGVFGGGDVVTGPNTVIDSIAAGKNAAVMVERYLSGRQMKVLKKVKLPTVYIEPAAEAEEEGEPAQRVEHALLAAQARQKNFCEVELCPDADAAQCEARRCLRCDVEFTQPI
jgi:NADH-quinone oxidoreductase subunit F